MEAVNKYQAEVEASQKNARDPDKLLEDVAEKIAKLEAELPNIIENFRSIVRFAPLSTPSELPRLGLLQVRFSGPRLIQIYNIVYT